MHWGECASEASLFKTELAQGVVLHKIGLSVKVYSCASCALVLMSRFFFIHPSDVRCPPSSVRVAGHSHANGWQSAHLDHGGVILPVLVSGFTPPSPVSALPTPVPRSQSKNDYPLTFTPTPTAFTLPPGISLWCAVVPGRTSSQRSCSRRSATSSRSTASSTQAPASSRARGFASTLIPTSTSPSQ